MISIFKLYVRRTQDVTKISHKKSLKFEIITNKESLVSIDTSLVWFQ